MGTVRSRQEINRDNTCEIDELEFMDVKKITYASEHVIRKKKKKSPIVRVGLIQHAAIRAYTRDLAFG